MENFEIFIKFLFTNFVLGGMTETLGLDEVCDYKCLCL